MPVYGGTTPEQSTRLQRRPNMPGFPQSLEHVLEYIEALDRAITDFYGRLAERAQFWVSNAGTATLLSGATTASVTFAGLEPDTLYAPLMIGDWATGGLWVSSLATT